MYILSVLLMIALLFISAGRDILYYVDVPSLLIVLLIAGSLLSVSGMVTDFKRGVRAAFSKENIYVEHELKKSILAVSLVIKLIVISGLFATLAGIIGYFYFLEEMELFFDALGVASLATLYALVWALLLIPVQYRLKKLLIDVENDHDEKNL